MKKKVVFISFLIVLISVLKLFPQVNGINFLPKADSLFYRGIEKYNTGFYEDAKDIFQRIASEKRNQKTLVSLYMIGRCLNKKGDYLQSVSFTYNYIDNFPF